MSKHSLRLSTQEFRDSDDHLAPLWWKSVLTTSISDGVLKANDGDNYNSLTLLLSAKLCDPLVERLKPYKREKYTIHWIELLKHPQ
jgi:hypothetical protein